MIFQKTMAETNPDTVEAALKAAFQCRMNLVECASYCGMTIREFKMAFREYMKYNPATYPPNEQQLGLKLNY